MKCSFELSRVRLDRNVAWRDHCIFSVSDATEKSNCVCLDPLEISVFGQAQMAAADIWLEPGQDPQSAAPSVLVAGVHVCQQCYGLKSSSFRPDR